MADITPEAPKNLGGRPLKFKTVKELQEAVDSYFSDCEPHMKEVTEWVEARDATGKLKKDEHGLNYLVEVTHKIMTVQQPLKITGLANWLGVDRKTLLNYKKRDKFFPTIDGALRKCEAYAEDMLYINAPGAKFTLINNYDWKEKQEVDHKTNGAAISPYIELTTDHLRSLAEAQVDEDHSSDSA